MGFQPALIEEPRVEAVRAACPAWETMLVTILEVILDRYESDPDHHFIDTKLNLITGEDFLPGPDPETDFKSKRVVYGWIQGRGLEAMAGHAAWLPECSVLSDRDKQALIARTRRLLEEVAAKMEELRARNGGRLFFTMTPEGQPLAIEGGCRVRPLERIPEGMNFSDLFYAKGLFAAAAFLGWEDKRREAGEYLLKGLADIEAETFVTDQQQLDPKNKVASVPGRRTQGYRMIALGALAAAYEHTGDPSWLERSEGFFRFLFTHHLNCGQFPGLEELDFVEFIDPENRPWVQDGEILSDSGHALELVGLALKLLAPMKDHPDAPASQKDLVRECEELLPRFFMHNFEIGFDHEHGGIRKAFGLISRRPINDDMPWWSLPETIRAAAELLAFVPETPRRRAILQALADCSNAFMRYYVNPSVHLMAYQTRNNRGEPIDVIPGTADADPGYHTGLSIIDFLRTMRAPG